MKEVLARFLSLLKTENPACLNCGKEVFQGELLCASCEEKYLPPEHVCKVCGRKLSEEGVCAECKQRFPAFTLARSCYSHEDTARNLLLRYKRGDRHLEKLISSALVSGFARYYAGESFDGIVYLPCSKREMTKKGFYPPKDLAESLSREIHLPLLTCLTKTRRTKKQKTLSFSKRKENVKNAFSASKDAKGKSILLLDDVMTTGATVEEAAATLKKRGAEKVCVLTFTSVPFRTELD